MAACAILTRGQSGRCRAGALHAELVNDPGIIRRLAMMEVEAMLWAEGTPLSSEDIGRESAGSRTPAEVLRANVIGHPYRTDKQPSKPKSHLD
ncbi:hypothetical protein [Paracoccus albus]|uniref:hypothetical protein n=1 Tax=Paracoccus albus TaxID=3017784 RepID=UPI0022F09ED1|nr:hypothetical protein [Paracoccus albus]WBU62076.1 hypothetical protein PAF20_17520 [Paracoccus albus]